MPDMPIAPKGSIASAISSVVVQLMREHTGRGPTRARTYINEDLITVVLQDTLTMGERSLVRDGEVDLVLASRKAFQRAMSREIIAAVEKHSRRTVLAFLGDLQDALAAFIASLERAAETAQAGQSPCGGANEFGKQEGAAPQDKPQQDCRRNRK